MSDGFKFLFMSVAPRNPFLMPEILRPDRSALAGRRIFSGRNSTILQRERAAAVADAGSECSDPFTGPRLCGDTQNLP
jgi:hypothetical protein